MNLDTLVYLGSRFTNTEVRAARSLLKTDQTVLKINCQFAGRLQMAEHEKCTDIALYVDVYNALVKISRVHRKETLITLLGDITHTRTSTLHILVISDYRFLYHMCNVRKLPSD